MKTLNSIIISAKRGLVDSAWQRGARLPPERVGGVLTEQLQCLQSTLVFATLSRCWRHSDPQTIILNDTNPIFVLNTNIFLFPSNKVTFSVISRFLNLQQKFYLVPTWRSESSETTCTRVRSDTHRFTQNHIICLLDTTKRTLRCCSSSWTDHWHFLHPSPLGDKCKCAWAALAAN